MSTPQIEYFYSAHSAFAYLGAWELDRIAKNAGAQVLHRPFDFWPVVDGANPVSIRERSEAQKGYFFGRELNRWAEWRELPIVPFRPTYHDAPLALASGVIIASEDPDAMSRAILQAHWRDDADISDAATLAALADDIGADGQALLAQAQGRAAQDTFAANTTEAIARNVFGSPTYFVDGDMFYGQDRLMMVERALTKPFAP